MLADNRGGAKAEQREQVLEIGVGLRAVGERHFDLRPRLGRAGQLRALVPGPPWVNTQVVRADLPLEAWSTGWLGYSRYDGIVVTRHELNAAPAVRTKEKDKIIRALRRLK